MKTNLPLIFAAIVLTSISRLQAQQTIHSTANGGLWPNNDTWIEAVPSNNDSVVLQGPVSMLSYIGWCKSINITSTGSLGGNGNQGNLYIYGSLYNNGNIVGSMNYTISGNIVNNQPWTGVDNHLLFTGNDHSISCAPGGSINAQLQADDSLQNFSLLTDVLLNTNQSSNLGFSQLDAGYHKLQITDGGFSNCRIHSMDTLHFDSWISSVSITGDYKLAGNITLYYNMEFGDRATNYGTIHFASGVGGDPLKIKGDFINKGIMAHSWIQTEKSITNQGIWECENTQFTGTGDKHISQSEGHSFGGGQFSSDNSGSMIFLDTDIELTVPAFHLYNNTLKCGDHKLTASTTFYDGTIISDAEIAGNNDFWNSTIKGNVILSGNNRFANPIMDGVIQNKGTLRDIQFYGGFFISYNHLINHNSIQSLTMKVYGDLTNFGTIDNNSIVEITGNIPQNINFTQSIESPTYFNSDIAGNSYQWMKDGSDLQNQVSQKLSFSSLQLSDAGVYKCRVITTEGSTVYSREIIVNNTTSLAENEIISEFRVFPNPFTDHAILQWDQKSVSKARIDILDAGGKLINTISNSVRPAGKNEVEFAADSKMQPGVYFLRLVENGKIKTVKLNYSR
jgi:hypothetical protein